MHPIKQQARIAGVVVARCEARASPARQELGPDAGRRAGHDSGDRNRRGRIHRLRRRLVESAPAGRLLLAVGRGLSRTANP